MPWAYIFHSICNRQFAPIIAALNDGSDYSELTAPFLAFVPATTTEIPRPTTMSTHIERAIEKIRTKDQIPDIDFTQHTLDDGNVISTQERVVKDVSIPSLSTNLRPQLSDFSLLGTSTSDGQAYA